MNKFRTVVSILCGVAGLFLGASLNNAYTECASQLIDINLLSYRADKINRHNQRYDRTCNTYKPIRQIVKHIQCNVRNNVCNEQSHYTQKSEDTSDILFL